MRILSVSLLKWEGFKYYRMVDVFSNLQFFVLNVNPHLFFCVLNPGQLFTNIFGKLYMVGTTSLSIYFIAKYETCPQNAIKWETSSYDLQSEN